MKEALVFNKSQKMGSTPAYFVDLCQPLFASRTYSRQHLPASCNWLATGHFLPELIQAS